MHRSNNLWTCDSGATSLQGWIFSHLIRSHRGTASTGKCVPTICVIASHLISFHLTSCLVSVFIHHISSHLVSSYLIISHLISLLPPHLISCLLCLPQLFSAHHNCLYLFSSEFFSFQHSSASPFCAARLNLALHRSSHVRSSQLIHLTSSQLFTAHWPKTCSKTRSRRQKPQKVRCRSL